MIFVSYRRKVTILACKSGKSTDRPWSGKVHKLCGLWSAEVLCSFARLCILGNCFSLEVFRVKKLH